MGELCVTPAGVDDEAMRSFSNISTLSKPASGDGVEFVIQHSRQDTVAIARRMPRS